MGNDPAGAPPHGKAIVLFSDGTGNSSGKLFKTNVWRTYEAVDLGPPAPGLRKQIAFYDNGVGTSAFRPLAALGGILGIGLKRNVLELYRFACRNYHAGDEIYAFGFSRGAFTIRLVIALIASQGLVPATTEAELLRGSRDAYRAYRTRYLPRYFPWATRAWRGVRDAITRAIDRARDLPRYDRSANHDPVLRFVGVWDTVAAYGGPVIEITRAIDNWFFALSMPNYGLNPRVRTARHALALDDEREAFQPLVWDEVEEARLETAGEVTVGRLQQLWFTGMHADVGGGYPDESLSYVSLLWMLEEAEKAGLRTLTAITDRHRALASSAGPIHNSRSGPGVYYRYQPRRLDALVEPPDPETRLAWEPERKAGLLTAVRLHESVAERIASGTDRYAPIAIPAVFEIHPPQAKGQNAPQPATGGGADAAAAPPPGARIPLLSEADRAALLDGERADGRAAAMRQVWDAVWWRRGVYFASLACTLVLVTLRWWPEGWRIAALCTDSRCVLPGIFSPVKAVLPDFLAPWIDSYAANPVPAVIAIVLLVMLFKAGGRLERGLRARAAAAWAATLGHGSFPDDRPGVARAVRRSGLYIAAMRLLRWQLLPLIAAVALAAGAVLVVGAAVTQTWLAVAERTDTLCANPTNTSTPVTFHTAAPCTDLGQNVVRGTRYRVTLRVIEPWCDDYLPADPARGVLRPPLWMAAATFQRRVTGANWFKPLLTTRRPDASGAARDGAKVRIDVPALQRTRAGLYEGTFVAGTSGRLYIGVNDAIIPFWPRAFYARNHGTAEVTITALPPAPDDRPSDCCADRPCAGGGCGENKLSVIATPAFSRVRPSTAS